MRLSADRDQLAQALAIAERAAAARDTLPVLSGVRLTAGESSLTVTATDLEVSAAIQLAADVELGGDRVVDARLLTALVRRLPGSTVRLAMGEDGSTLQVECGPARFSLLSMGPQEFPELPRVTDGWRLEIAASRLRQAIGQTLFAAASSDQRPLLSGVLVEVEGSTARLVATDSSRLAYRELPLDQPPSPVGSPGLFTPRVIVPGKAVAEMQRLCDLAEDTTVALYLGERLASLELEGGRATLTTRLIDGNFPQYRQVFLEGLPTRVSFDRRQMLEAVQRAALLSRRGPAVVVLDIGSEGIRVNAREADVGHGEELVEAELQGPPVTTAYQAHFLEDVLKVAEAETLELEVGDPTRQGTIRIPGDPGYRYIVMPVRLG